MTSASAPASSANLGPGYDVLALALGLRCTVAVEPADRWEVVSASSGGEDMVEHAAVAADQGCGPLRVTVTGSVPVARGLGSSAALIVATMAATDALGECGLDRAELMRRAAAVEGHPDNVAAAVYGGLVAVGVTGRVHHLEVHPALRVLVAVPEKTLSTAAARRATAGSVDTAVAARTAARLSFLIEGLRTADTELLRQAGGDELHEARRAPLSPLTAGLVDSAREAGAGHAAWSGAGPSAMAVVVSEDDAAAVRASWETVLASDGGRIIEPGIDTDGVVVDRV
jgi:homoserine kinase